MAELVQRRIEERIPELEQLERVGLFTKKEIKSMLKRTTALEYKLHRRDISKDDFIAFIQYEINVLELVKKRRTNIGYHFKRDDIEFPIMHRVNNTFRRATSKWQEDVQLWLSHVAFCKKWSTKGELSKVFSSMLAVHPDKPALWIMAAKCEMEDRGSSESARHLFLRALRFHPESKKVYQEYFRMELMHAEKLRRQQEQLEKAKIDVGEYEFSPEILSGKLAEVVYRDATQKIKGAEFVLSLLQIASIFDFSKDLQATILQELQSQHTDDSVTWDFMAKRELEVTVTPELQTAKGKASDTDRKEERCCAVYEEGVKNLNTEAMWTCYANFCLDKYKRKTNVQELKDKRRQRLLKALQGAHQAELLPQNFYKTWESLPLWLQWIQWSESNRSAEETEALFQKGLLSPVPDVSSAVKEKYLEWSCRTGGYKKARKTFTSLHEHRPFSKAFFTTMIQIEKQQETPKMNNVRDCYERALREFGSADDDLWMDYIKEERGPHGQPENCGKLHWRAMKALEGDGMERFITQYTLLQTGHI
ncbi:U3 small nucleolar RNA-associated protein 6 homolog isoform X2 [Sardina pilchardus]|uniref:U3 small nucleolar RNA-associated protein 6 homolog isoform X2 n=1 Tax=Sardina pilchardus TaxID=27697 RepID=UPI002E1370F6